MNREYEVSVDVWIDRTVWRFLGFGDQPRKSEVEQIYRDFVAEMDENPINRRVTARYAGAPGHYVVSAAFSVSRPWWKALGFGDTSSVGEVQRYFEAKTGVFSNNYRVKVTRLAKNSLPK